MKHHNMLPFRALVAVGLMGVGATADQTYCSSQNTGSGHSQGTDIYMSNGLCSDTCRSQYAFAVVQYQSCWCSNYIPADQDDTGSCSQNCPGYPQEQCGDTDSGLFGYIALDIAPLGTAGAASVASSAAPSTIQEPSSTVQPSTAPVSTEEPETRYVSTTIVKTVTPTQSSPRVVVSYVTPSTTSTPVTTSTTDTTSTPASTTSTHAKPSSVPPTTEHSATPVTSVVMTTISGAVVTQTVTSTPVVIPNSHTDSVPLQHKKGLGAGAIAGIVIGVLVGIALIAAAAFLAWRRRRNEDDERQEGGGAASKKNMTRNVSVLSKAGLLSRNNTRPSMGERDHEEYHVSPTGQNSVRHSMLFAANDGVSPVSPLDSSHSDSSRRLSKPMVYDQRLNPSALFANQEANGSRISMQDTQDYSRPLGVMNPDVRASFESRISHK